MYVSNVLFFQEPGSVHHRYHMYFMEQEMCSNTDIAVQR